MSTPANTETPRELKPFLLGLGIGGMVMVIVLITVCAMTAKGHARVWNLLLVAMGSVSMGMFMGFLLAAYGEENAQFSKSFSAVTGLLGGVALTELTAQNQYGILLRTLRSLSVACGIGSTALAGTVVVSFGSMGFFLMYVVKKLYLNRATVQQDLLNGEMMKDAAKVAQKIDEAVKESQQKGEERPRISAELKAQAGKVAARLLPLTEQGYSIVFEQGMLHFGSGDYDRAADCFRKVLDAEPTHAQALYYLGYSLIQQGVEERAWEARTYLERSRQAGNADPYIDKLLGYSLLFAKPRGSSAKEAEQATLRYLKVQPGDPGAQLNLACAYAQQGPDLPGNHDRVVAQLKTLLQKHPQYKPTVRGLMSGDDDFVGWDKFDDFKALVA